MTSTTTALVLVEADAAPAPLALTTVPVAEGGDATIHAVDGRPELVAKLYRDPGSERRRRAKLDAMLASPPAGREAEHRGRRSVQLAWPLALIERDGNGPDDPPAGFVMARVHLDEAVVLEQMLSGRARRAAGLSDAVRVRVAAARNLSAVVAALHAEGHHVIDLKPSNVHVYRDTSFVAVLDCDGFSVAGPDGARFPAHQYTDGYIAPEALRAQARPEALGEAQDRFALAVVVFRLLNRGLHPFQGVPAVGASVPTTDGERVAAGLYPYGSGADRLSPPPASLYASFDRATRRLFDRAFDGPDAKRPTAAQWAQHLSTLLAPGGLRPCPNDPDHAVYPGVADCGVCGQGARPTPRPARPPAASATPVTTPTSSGLLSTRRGYIGTLVALSAVWFGVFQAMFGPDEPDPYTDDTSETYHYDDVPPPPGLPMPPPPPPPPPGDLRGPEVYEVTEVQPELVGGLESLQAQIDYPEAARRAGIEGTVYVQFIVDETGRAVDPVVLRSPSDLLSEAALDAVRGSEFRLGSQRGRPVKVRFSVPVRFELR